MSGLDATGLYASGSSENYSFKNVFTYLLIYLLIHISLSMHSNITWFFTVVYAAFVYN